MAPKKRKPEPEVPARPVGRPSKNLARLNLKVPAPIREALVSLALRNRRNIVEEALIAFEKHLRENGCLPEGYTPPGQLEQ
jgi:hypothetical protein